MATASALLAVVYFFSCTCWVFHHLFEDRIRETEFFQLSELQQRRVAVGKSYLEFLRVPAMSAGVYVIPAGASDPQKPHKEEELYYVIRGRARMRAGTESRSVSAGSMIFVAAGVEHHFHDIEEELTVLVFFAPAES